MSVRYVIGVGRVGLGKPADAGVCPRLMPTEQASSAACTTTKGNMNSGIETVGKDSRHQVIQETPEANVAEPRPATKNVLGLTLIGAGVFGAGGMWAWIIFQAVHWVFQTEAVLLQGPWPQEPFW
jgi:hypothetical protein